MNESNLMGNSTVMGRLPFFSSIFRVEKSIPLLLYTTAFGISVFGNTLILATVCSSKVFRKPVNYLIGNLALSALLFTMGSALYLIERNVHLWPESTNGFICQILAGLHMFGNDYTYELIGLPVPAENFTVMLISIDRAKLMENPLGKEQKGQAILKIILTWFFALLLILPACATAEYDENLTTIFKCKKVLLGHNLGLHASYISLYSFIGHVFPSIVLIKELFKLKSQLDFLRINRLESDRRVGIIQNAMVFNFIYILLEIPLILLLFPYQFPENTIPPMIKRIAGSYLKVIFATMFVHGGLYPLLIFLLSRDLRKFLKNFCKCQKNISNFDSIPSQLIEKPVLAVPIYNSEKKSGVSGCSIKLLTFNSNRDKSQNE